MADSNAYIEKRQFERVAARIQVTYHEIPEADAERLIASQAYKDISVPDPREIKVKDVMRVVTENISMGGLMIVGDKPFKSGQTVNVEMQLPQAPVPIKSLAVIVRGSEQPGPGGKYTAGVRFLALNKDDVARLERFIVLQKRAEQSKKS